MVHWGFGLIDVGRRDRFGRFDATSDVPTSSIGHRVSLFFDFPRANAVRSASIRFPLIQSCHVRRLVSRRLTSKLQATEANLQWENLRFHFPSLARNKKERGTKKE